MKLSKVLVAVVAVLVTAGVVSAASIYAYNIKVDNAWPNSGDANLVKLPNGKYVLIDGGPNSSTSTNQVIPFLNARAIGTISYMVLSHAHADHVPGLTAVINSGKTVGAVYDPKATYSSTAYTNFKNAVAAHGIPYIQSYTGDVYSWDTGSYGTSGYRVGVRVLNARTSYSDLNNTSIVLRLTFGSDKYLFTGDALTNDTENLMLANQSAYLANVYLKVGHHGSQYSSSDAFLTAVNPTNAARRAFIDVGAGNPYGHPALATLTRLGNHGFTVYRTDTQGNIKTISYGSGSYTTSINQ